ncbi:MAG TPA: Xaa-Pro peptidase family protein, partial [Vicinamibacterales bacterium]|nr:Xaa-Pro peptidase family protein [Vicinamibacterales bacterium]
GCSAQAPGPSEAGGTPAAIAALRPMTDGIAPISRGERLARIAKAQELMVRERLDAIFMEGTATCFYYTGTRWGQSERTFGVVIPARGELAWVCPKFEESRALELITFGTEVRTWEEDESPYALIAAIVRDRGARFDRVGVEERVRFFIADGVRKAAPAMTIADATPVTAGCRMYKSPTELALMQRANDVTIEAYRAAFTTMREGMTQGELSANIAAAFRALGFDGSASVQVGQWSALPHGSITPQKLREGDVVLVDGGTGCEGYRSDITRTTVLGRASQRQIDVWNIELEAQNAAFAAARIGAPCEAVDAAARAVIEAAGFGPGYKTPGLPHRTGHGIGLEGHEWTNFVKGNKTPLAPGMCFSDEPMIAIPGEFGIRLEDCLYMTADGPKFFTRQSVSIGQPFG